MAVKDSLLKAANGEDFLINVTQLAESCYTDDVNLSDLARHLPLLQDVIMKGSLKVKKVTSV